MLPILWALIAAISTALVAPAVVPLGAIAIVNPIHSVTLIAFLAFAAIAPRLAIEFTSDFRPEDILNGWDADLDLETLLRYTVQAAVQPVLPGKCLSWDSFPFWSYPFLGPVAPQPSFEVLPSALTILTAPLSTSSRTWARLSTFILSLSAALFAFVNPSREEEDSKSDTSVRCRSLPSIPQTHVP